MSTKSQLIKAAEKSAQIIKKTALNQVENLENLNLSVKRLKLGVQFAVFLLLAIFAGTIQAQNMASIEPSGGGAWESSQVYVNYRPVARLNRYGGICIHSTKTESKVRTIWGNKRPVYIAHDERTYYPKRKLRGGWKRHYFKK